MATEDFGSGLGMRHNRYGNGMCWEWDMLKMGMGHRVEWEWDMLKLGMGNRSGTETMGNGTDR